MVTKAITALVVGKTAMTATGRATLIAGLFTGSCWLYSTAQDRKAANMRADADRQAASMSSASRAAEERAFRAYETAHETWRKKTFKKGQEPKYQDYKDNYK